MPQIIPCLFGPSGPAALAFAMAKDMRRIRLHGKQPCPWQRDEMCQKSKKPKKVQRTVKNRKNQTARASAVKDGTLPPARRAFAIWVQDHVVSMKGGSRETWKLEMKRLGRLWHAASQKEKEPYFAKSRAEFEAQRVVMKELGLKLRASQTARDPQAMPDLAEDLPEDLPEEEPTKIGSFKVLESKGHCHQLGEGSYGSVFLCVDKLERKCAVKVYKGLRAVEELQHEASILRIVQNEVDMHLRLLFPSLLHVETSRRPYCFLALEYFGASVLACLDNGQKFRADESLAIAKQLKAALVSLHQLQILHLDLKTANILWCNNQKHLKLADFGMSEFVPGSSRCEAKANGQDSLRFGEYVTAYYRPPELWDASLRELRQNLQPSVDLWSYGCCIYEVATSKILMRPIDYRHKGCHCTIQQWCQYWPTLHLQCRDSQSMIPNRLRARVEILPEGLKPILWASLNPTPALRSWSRKLYWVRVCFLGAWNSCLGISNTVPSVAGFAVPRSCGPDTKDAISEHSAWS